ncbi:hypothetical protein L1F19_26940, partial [Pseudomonas juntendi]|nr:hypothetical protein [Pseudomonas juntendi]
YGSGHLHQLNLDGQVISDMERDDLHREVYRTQGKLTSCFGYDAMGRKAWQFASTLPTDKLSQVHNTGINTSLLGVRSMNPTYHMMGQQVTVASLASSSTAEELRSRPPTMHT